MPLARSAALSMTLALSTLTAWPDLSDEPTWYTDYAKALAQARQTGQPIFAVFT
jgi:hypothetical protein